MQNASQTIRRTIRRMTDSHIGKSLTAVIFVTLSLAFGVVSRRNFSQSVLRLNCVYHVVKKARIDRTAEARKEMKKYLAAHPRSPSAARRPQLSIRSGLWIARLGPSVEEGTIGIGPTVKAALRALDTQYLASLPPPAPAINSRRALR